MQLNWHLLKNKAYIWDIRYFGIDTKVLGPIKGGQVCTISSYIFAFFKDDWLFFKYNIFIIKSLLATTFQFLYFENSKAVTKWPTKLSAFEVFRGQIR